MRPAADEPASPSGGPHHCLCRVDMNVSLPHPPWTSMPAASSGTCAALLQKRGVCAGMRAKCPVPFGPGHSSFPGGIPGPPALLPAEARFLRPSHVFFNRTQMAVFMISGGRNSHSAGRRLYAAALFRPVTALSQISKAGWKTPFVLAFTSAIPYRSGSLAMRKAAVPMDEAGV